MYVLFTQNEEVGWTKYEVGKVTRRKAGRKDWPYKVVGSVMTHFKKENVTGKLLEFEPEFRQVNLE